MAQSQPVYPPLLPLLGSAPSAFTLYSPFPPKAALWWVMGGCPKWTQTCLYPGWLLYPLQPTHHHWFWWHVHTGQRQRPFSSAPKQGLPNMLEAEAARAPMRSAAASGANCVLYVRAEDLLCRPERQLLEACEVWEAIASCFWASPRDGFPLSRSNHGKDTRGTLAFNLSTPTPPLPHQAHNQPIRTGSPRLPLSVKDPNKCTSLTSSTVPIHT